MNHFYGIPLYKGPDIKTPVRARTHRKRRIDKKYEKKYGYKMVSQDYCYLIDSKYLSLDFGITGSSF